MWVTISIKWIVRSCFRWISLKGHSHRICSAPHSCCCVTLALLSARTGNADWTRADCFFTVVDLTNPSNNLREIHVSILTNPSYKMWPCCVLEQEMHIEWTPIVLFTEFRQNVVWPVTSYTRCSISIAQNTWMKTLCERCLVLESLEGFVGTKWYCTKKGNLFWWYFLQIQSCCELWRRINDAW